MTDPADVVRGVLRDLHETVNDRVAALAALDTLEAQLAEARTKKLVELDAARREIEELKAERESAEARIVELEEALYPFAARALNGNSHHDEDIQRARNILNQEGAEK